MDKEEFKQVCLNLRSVTQSCKGGVPLNRLEYDYKALLGTNIPYKNLGFESLESLIWNIPDVVRVKITNGQRVVEGVADQSTAHIANMISKQKKSKAGPPTVKIQKGSKPPVAATKKLGNQNQNNNLPSAQNSANAAQSNSKTDELKKAVKINLRSVIMSSKEGVLFSDLQRDYRNMIGTLIPFELLGHKSLQSFIQSIPDVVKLKTNKSGKLVAEAVPDASTSHISSLIGRQKQSKKKAIQNVKKPPKIKSLPKVNYPLVRLNSTIDLDSSVDSLSVQYQSSCSSKTASSRPVTPQETSKEKNFTTNNSNPFTWSGKSLSSFPSIKNNITNAHFSTLLGLYNLIFGVSYMDTLKESILKFGGYLFLSDSEEWKKREFLLSVLPMGGLTEYLNLLCVKHSVTEEKHALLNKLLTFIATLRTEMIDPCIKMEEKLADSDFYKKYQEKDKQIAEITQENKDLKTELLKLKLERGTLLLEKSAQEKTTPDSAASDGYAKDNIIITQSAEIDNLKAQVAKLSSLWIETCQVAQQTKDEKKQLEDQLNTVKNERSSESKSFSKQRENFKCTVEKLEAELLVAVNKAKQKEKEKGKFECELNTLKHEKKVEAKSFEAQRENFKCIVKKLEAELLVAENKAKQKEKEKGKFECELNTLKHEKKVEAKSFEAQRTEFVKYLTTLSNKRQHDQVSNAAKIVEIEKKLSNYEEIINKVHEQSSLLRNKIENNPSCPKNTLLPVIDKLLKMSKVVQLQTQQNQPPSPVDKISSPGASQS